MKTKILPILIVLLALISRCSSPVDSIQLIAQLENRITTGNLKEAVQLADSIKKHCMNEPMLVHKADSLQEIAGRIALDFSLTEEQVVEKLNKNHANFSPEEKASWEKLNWLEWRMINGEKRYFNRAASNLVLVKDFHTDRHKRDSLKRADKELIFRKNHTEKIINNSAGNSMPVVPVEMNIEYTLTVKPDVVPQGEIIRCWLPWPKENHSRQQKITLVSASQADFIIAPDSAIHRTIYMEAKSVKGLPLIFKVLYSYQSSGQYFDLNNLSIKPYDKTSPLYKKYTSEQLPQICFTEKVKSIADIITGNETNPAIIVKKMFRWFGENIPWAGALEYSIMPNIPEYVLLNRKGDCGMQTFLLMSMLRYEGIPVKWQSGWMMPPDAENLHDWCEIYYEGIGWVPADISYGLQYSDKVALREFYTAGIDSYRLIINDGTSGPLYPEKKYLRSDPFDFQRGEVEWEGGNLYYDKWNYKMKIEYK